MCGQVCPEADQKESPPTGDADSVESSRKCWNSNCDCDDVVDDDIGRESRPSDDPEVAAGFLTFINGKGTEWHDLTDASTQRQ